MSRVDFLIVGQGLAGTALAWHLRRRGRRVMIVDRERGGCSRVAAGLLTSVTGNRLTPTRRWGELFRASARFYCACEAELGLPFFRTRPAIRLFSSGAERAKFEKGRDGALRGLVRELPCGVSDWFDAPLGGFEMDAARLDVAQYLDASREQFRETGEYRNAETDPREIEFAPDCVRIPTLAVEAGTVVFCRGFAPDEDPWFGAVQFRAAKGEILTLRVRGLAEERVVHRGVWLVPVGSEQFRAGATYSWAPLDAVPSAEGRAEIEARLREFLKLPFEVLAHHAAVRPVVHAGLPTLGRHPQFPRLAYFNGLGSKGSLLAPYYADQLAAHLCGEGGIDPEVNVSRFLVHPQPPSG